MRWWRRRQSPAGFRPAAPYLLAGAREARSLGHDAVGTEHVLLAMLRQRGDACRLLRRVDVSPIAVEETLGLQPAAGARIDREALASLGVDLDAIRDRLESSVTRVLTRWSRPMRAVSASILV